MDFGIRFYRNPSPSSTRFASRRKAQRRSIARVLTLAALCLSLPAGAADLPKSGSYSGHYGWTFTGQAQQLGEDRTVYAGVMPGVMFNDEGKGFMHKAGVDCTIFVEWKCSGVMPARCGIFVYAGPEA